MKTTFLQKIITIFWKQNSWHSHGVFIHTLKVTWWAIKNWNYKMISAWLLHDIWKPIVATRDNSKELSFSFHGHEEKSYQMIKNIPFISDYTKKLVRWHYLIRWISKAEEKSLDKKRTPEDKIHWKNENERQKKVWANLDENFKKDLALFLKFDDYGK